MRKKRKGFECCAFVGGTALRVLHDLKRYSEDLDFSALREGFSAKPLFTDIEADAGRYGFAVETKHKMEGAVQSCWFRFKGLLYDLKISGIKDQRLSIKMEIDTRPPAGAVVAVAPVNTPFMFLVRTFDLPSSLATKLHACFFRKYTKGRDFYDLLWYRGKKVIPNYILLNNAIEQTQKVKLNITPETIKSFLRERVNAVDFDAVRKDVGPFIENKDELKMLKKDTFTAIIDSWEL